jgi:hypothetical protein
MKTVMLAAAAMTLAVAVNPASAPAAQPNADSGAAMSWSAMTPASASSMSPRYEWQYHYGRHTQFEGHWVLVR